MATNFIENIIIAKVGKKIVICIEVGIIIFIVIIMIPIYFLTQTMEDIAEFFGFKEESKENELYVSIVDFREKYSIEESNIIEFNGVLPMPVNNAIVTSDFGGRIHPITGKLKFHTGIDLVGEWHSNIICVADGKVVIANVYGGYGNCVEIEHTNANGEKYYTLYGHLAQINVSIGQEVKQGEIIGLQGGDPKLDKNPGSSTGTHLHFEIRKSKNGDYQNPRPYLFFESSG